MQVRKTVSLTTFLTFVVLAVSGTVLYVVPQGRVANWAGWSLAGLSKDDWSGLHIATALLFVVAGVWHTVLNWKLIVAYLRDRAQRLRVLTPDFLAALVLTVAVSAAALLQAPPVSWVLDLNASLKNSAARKWGEPPYGHAELSSLGAFAAQTGLDAGRALELLRQSGMKVDGPEQTLAAIAGANGVTPQRVYETIRPARAQRASGDASGVVPSGLGKREVGDLCEELGIPVQQGVAVLVALGCAEARPDATLRSLAETVGRRPVELYELLRVVAGKSPAVGAHGAASATSAK